MDNECSVMDQKKIQRSNLNDANIKRNKTKKLLLSWKTEFNGNLALKNELNEWNACSDKSHVCSSCKKSETQNRIESQILRAVCICQMGEMPKLAFTIKLYKVIHGVSWTNFSIYWSICLIIVYVPTVKLSCER